MKLTSATLGDYINGGSPCFPVLRLVVIDEDLDLGNSIHVRNVLCFAVPTRRSCHSIYGNAALLPSKTVDERKTQRATPNRSLAFRRSEPDDARKRRQKGGIGPALIWQGMHLLLAYDCRAFTTRSVDGCSIGGDGYRLASAAHFQRKRTCRQSLENSQRQALLLKSLEALSLDGDTVRARKH